jgi:CRP-like cAMP-binding protein
MPRLASDLPDSQSPFQELLQRLSEEHDREVAYLSSTCDKLRAALKKASISDPTAWQEPLYYENDLSRDSLPWEAKDTSAAVRLKPPQLASAPDASSGGAVEIETGNEEIDSSKLGEEVEDIPRRFNLRNCWSRDLDASESIVDELDASMVCKNIYAMAAIVHHDEEEDHLTRKRSHLSLKHVFFGFCPRSLLLNPGQPTRVVWDLTGMFFISYEMLSIPMHMAFQPEPHIITTMMGWVTLVFWSMDMFASLFTGYYKNGKLVMDQQAIMLNYFRGWFWVDCIVVLPDWVLKAMGSVTNVAGLGRILRIVRVMRVLRLLRLLKLKKVFALVYDVIDSEVMFIVVNLIKLLTVILVMNHIVACAWYLVGRLTMESGAPRNWLQDRGIQPVYDKSLEWKYLTALHWSITQFTPASMDVSATNVAERFFSIVILFWALVALSSIIGSVSASMTALRNMSSDENKQFWILRRYLRQKHIPRDLCQRIIKYLEHQQLQKHNTVPASSVKLLPALSERFQIQLSHELNAPILKEHPFFRHMNDGSGLLQVTLYRLCHNAVQSHSYALEEVVFNPGDEGRRMYFVKSGSFEYRMINDCVVDAPLGFKLWAAEASLWTHWRHHGTLTASCPSEAIGILPQKFSDQFHQHPRSWYFARNYAVEFVEYLKGVGAHAQTDLLFDFDIWSKHAKAADTYQLCRSLSLTSRVSSDDLTSKANTKDSDLRLTVEEEQHNGQFSESPCPRGESIDTPTSTRELRTF